MISMTTEEGDCTSPVRDIIYIYRRGLWHFGDPMWWPGTTPWEIAVGAILTQNTAWVNVEKALKRMKEAGIFTPWQIIDAPLDKLAETIRPSGYFNQKAIKLKALSRWVIQRFDGDIARARALGLKALKEELISLWGVGQETRDSIILYALDLPTFVVDRYTVRILKRFGLALPQRYEDAVEYVKEVVEGISSSTQFLNRLHALFVLLGKNYCGSRPQCHRCPLSPRCMEAKTVLKRQK